MFAVTLLAILLRPTQAIVSSSTSSRSLHDLGPGLPECASLCLASTKPNSPCPLNDLDCLCTNDVLVSRLTVCIQKECTVKEALTSKNFTAAACQLPIRDRTREVLYPGLVGMALAIMSVMLRILYRLPGIAGHFGVDDIAVITSTVVMIPLSLFAIFMTHYGLGKDVWTVPFDDITNMLRLYYFDAMMYVTSLGLTRISILLLYIRIFTTSQPFRQCAYALVALHLLFLVAFDIAVVFQCHPISFAWTRWDGQHQGRCLNVNGLGWSAAGFNIALDLATIALPLPQLVKLWLPWHKKLPLVLLFMLGFLVTIISCIRLQCMAEYGNSMNMTWDYAPIGYWSAIELHLSIIIACLPSIRALVLRCVTKWFKPKINAHHITSQPLGVGRNDFVHLEDMNGKFVARFSEQPRLDLESRDTFQ